MKVCVLSCSPKGENSLTYHSARMLIKYFPNDEFDFHFTMSTVCPDDVVDSACSADLILILSSIFHLNVHGQMISMLPELTGKMRAKLGADFDKKFFTYITTSNFLYDIGAHKYMERWAKSEKINYLRFLSLKDDSILSENGREELYRWFCYTKDTMECLSTGKVPQVTEARRVAIVNDGYSKSCEEVKKLFEERGCEVEIFNLLDYKIKPCTACFGCYSNRKCHIDDDVCMLLDKIGTGTDCTVTMGNLKLGMLSQQFKFYTDRHVQWGRCGTSDEMVLLSLLDTDEDIEDRTVSLMEYAQWDMAMNGIGRDYGVGAFFSRIGDEKIDVSRQVDDTILIMNNELIGQRSIFSECLNTRFADLAYYLQFMVPLDYEHYKKDGYYEKRPMNTNVRYVDDVKGGVMSCKMRLMPYNMAFAEAGDKPKLTKRRKYKNMSFLEHKIKGDAEGSSSKGGFKGLFGKK